jgi:hypothetical protein
MNGGHGHQSPMFRKAESLRTRKLRPAGFARAGTRFLCPAHGSLQSVTTAGDLLIVLACGHTRPQAASELEGYEN